MIMLQISSAQGPVECQLAVSKALRRLENEAGNHAVTVELLEQEDGERGGTLRSVLLELRGDAADVLARSWIGTVQWICESPYRPGHRRKNWFIGVERCEAVDTMTDGEIRFEAMRARGPGGQHVNKTSSAIRATHIATGVSVRVESERSQHANRNLARALLSWKLRQRAEEDVARQRRNRRDQHFAVQRGNPVKVFRGDAFELVR